MSFYSKSWEQGPAEIPERKEVLKPLYVARLGLDLIRDSEGKYYCIEFNGHSSGVGIDRVPGVDQDEKSRVRAIGEPGVSNPKWLQEIAGDKGLQSKFIPEGYRVPEIREGESYASFLENDGRVVLKKRDSAQGEDVHIFDRETLENARAKASEDGSDFAFENDKVPQGYIAQKFIAAQGAGKDFAPRGMENNPASIRFLVDVQVYEDGTFSFKNIEGFQRISKLHPKILERGTSEGEDKHGRGPEVSLSDVYVVNSCRGAASGLLSVDDYKAAKAATESIIHNLVEAHRHLPDYLTDAERSAETTAANEQWKLQSRRRAEQFRAIAAWEQAGYDLEVIRSTELTKSIGIQHAIARKYRWRIRFTNEQTPFGDPLPRLRFMEILEDQFKVLESTVRGRQLIRGLTGAWRETMISQVPSEEDAGYITLLWGNETSRIPFSIESEDGLYTSLQNFSTKRENWRFAPTLRNLFSSKK